MISKEEKSKRNEEEKKSFEMLYKQENIKLGSSKNAK